MSSASVLFDAPGPRARARNRVFNVVTALVIALMVWVVYSKLDAKGQLIIDLTETFTGRPKSTMQIVHKKQ